MSARQSLMLACALVLLLALAPDEGTEVTAAFASGATFSQDWATIGEVQGGVGSSPHYRLLATVGQMGANTVSSSAGYALCVGFQSVPAYNYPLELPIVVRERVSAYKPENVFV